MLICSTPKLAEPAVEIDFRPGHFGQAKIDCIDASGEGIGIVIETVRCRGVGNRDVDAIDTLDVVKVQGAVGLVGLNLGYAADVGHVDRVIIRLKRLDLEGFDALGRKGGIFALAIGQRQTQGILAAAAVQHVTQLQGGTGCEELVSTIAAGQDVLFGRQNEGLRQDVVVDDGAGGSHRRSQGDTGELDLDGFVGLVNGIALHLTVTVAVV